MPNADPAAVRVGRHRGRSVVLCLIALLTSAAQCMAASWSDGSRRVPMMHFRGAAASEVVRLPWVDDGKAPEAPLLIDYPLGQKLSPQFDDAGVEPGPQLGRWLRDSGRRVRADHASYYSRGTIYNLALGIAAAAPLANTSADQDVRDWWQSDMRTTSSDGHAAFWKAFGEGQFVIPAMVCLGLAGGMLDDSPVFSACGTLGDRATRAYLVGGPPVLLMQVLLGASRPGAGDYNSHWKPFDASNAVSGHAFVGAVPFITAAQMTENRAARAFLYLGSTCTAWSRINDDAHFLSQAVLGWYMAYLACRSVEAVDRGIEPVAILPFAGPEFTGLGLLWRR